VSTFWGEEGHPERTPRLQKGLGSKLGVLEKGTMFLKGEIGTEESQYLSKDPFGERAEMCSGENIKGQNISAKKKGEVGRKGRRLLRDTTEKPAPGRSQTAKKRGGGGDIHSWWTCNHEGEKGLLRKEKKERGNHRGNNVEKQQGGRGHSLPSADGLQTQEGGEKKPFRRGGTAAVIGRGRRIKKKSHSHGGRGGERGPFGQECSQEKVGAGSNFLAEGTQGRGFLRRTAQKKRGGAGGRKPAGQRGGNKSSPRRNIIDFS